MTRRLSQHALIALGLVATAPAAVGAQALLDRSVRTGPQVVSYKFDMAGDPSITQFALPIAVAIPMFNRLSLDLATAWASVTYDDGATESKIDGLTDTQLRASYVLGTDNVVFTLGLNLPTGQETVNYQTQGAAAGIIGNDFLAFPISNMGTGFAGTGGVALARTAGSWNIGAGASFRRTAEFEPFTGIPGAGEGGAEGGEVRFQPGDEYRIRAGADRAVGAGSLALGVTYFTFGDDDDGTTTYSSGDRWLAQAGYSRPLGGTTLALAVWDLYRLEGKLAGDVVAASENILNLGAALGFRVGARGALEPNLEWRRWTVDGESAGNLGLFGVRARLEAGRLAFVPSVSLATGSLTAGGSSGSDGLSGWRGVLTIQYR